MALPKQNYVDIKGAFEILKDMGLATSESQVRSAVDRGKLPFFKCPMTGKRIIAEETLREVYAKAQMAAYRKFLDG